MSVLIVFSPPICAQDDDNKTDPALEQYFVANGAYNRKLYPIAIQQFEEFLAAHPGHEKTDLARRGLALSRYASKQYEEALAPLATLLAKKPLDPAISRERLVMMRGQCLLATGAGRQARDLYVSEMDALQSPAFRAAALAAICDVSFESAAWDEVLKWSDSLLRAQPTADQSARASYQQGYAHYQLGNPEKAIAALDRLASLEAGDAWKTRAAFLAGDCYNQLAQYAKAETAFAAALPQLEGADALECRYRLGATRFSLEKYEEAAADLAVYLAEAADGVHAPQARLFLARTALEAGDFAKAGSQLASLAAGKGEIAARASLWLARVHTRTADKDYAAAAKVLATATKSFADSAVIDELRFDYGNALMAQPEPDWKTALSAFDAIDAKKTFDQRAEVLNQGAVCLQNLGELAQSLAANDAFLTDHPAHPLASEARFMRAENLFLLGRDDDALAAYASFLKSHPEHPSSKAAVFRQAQIHHRAGRWDDCLATAKPLLSAEPADPLFPQLPFMVGDAHFRLENWADAIPPLQRFLASRKADGTQAIQPAINVDTALLQLAVAHDRMSEPASALTYLKLLADDYPEETSQLPLALAELGRLAYETGNLDLARASFERFLSSDTAENELFSRHAASQRPRVHYYLGWIEAAQGKPIEAAGRFAEVVELDPAHPLAPDAALQQGIALINAEQYPGAASHLGAILNRYPQHPKRDRLLFHQGLALAQQAQWDEAASLFEQLTRTFPKSEMADRALYERAWCERARDKMSAAMDLYEALLEDYPQSPLAPKVQAELAELHLDSGAQDKMIAELGKSLQRVEEEPLREELRYQLASAHFKKGDYQNAASQFEALLKDYPKSSLRASMHFQAGESQLQLEQPKAAHTHFAAAAQLAKEPSALVESITMRLAETQALTGDHSGAARTYKAFLARFPESRWTRNARFGFALATEEAGNPQAALAEYSKLRTGAAVDLWTVRSTFRKGVCHEKLKQLDDAAVEFVKVEISYPQYPAWQARAILEMGRLLQVQEKPAEAAERFQEVVRRFPKEAAANEARELLSKAPQ